MVETPEETDADASTSTPYFNQKRVIIT